MTQSRASIDRETYLKALKSGNNDTCFHIENLYGLAGYPPELVTVGLSAIVKGDDPDEIIEQYLELRNG